MKVLILGGTRFVGRHVVEALLRDGHDVSIFNRGKHPNPFDGVEVLVGDRDGDHSALGRGRWDRAIDVSGYTARQLRRSVAALGDAVDHYTFVSTVSVYRRPADPPIDEGSPLLEADHGADPGYGEGKVACEAVVREAFPGAHLIVRPGIVAGPHDYTDRFTWWALRMREEGEVILPGHPDRPVQLIDVRDLADWVAGGAAEARHGTFDLVGPDEPLTMRGFLERLRGAFGSDADPVPIADELLGEAGVTPRELPFWSREDPTVFMVSGARARSAGLRTRPLEDTARDTVTWIGEGTDPDTLAAGLLRAREREILASATG